MSASRLFEIIYYLVEHNYVQANELAAYFEVSMRTIYRDLDRLIAAGFPIYTKKGYQGGIYIDENFILSKDIFTKIEREQILTALQSSNLLDGNQNDDVINKVAVLFNQKKIDWIEIDLDTWSYCNNLNELFKLLKGAILNQLIVKFNYTNGKGIKSKRMVQPTKLFFKANTWYLQAYCLDKVCYRIFRLTRMRNLKITKEHFDIVELPPKISNYRDCSPLIDIVLEFDKSIGNIVFDEFNNAVIKENDCSYLVEAQVPNNYWLISFILSFGSKVKVIAPEIIKHQIIEEIDKIKKIYD